MAWIRLAHLFEKAVSNRLLFNHDIRLRCSVDSGSWQRCNQLAKWRQKRPQTDVNRLSNL